MTLDYDDFENFTTGWTVYKAGIGVVERSIEQVSEGIYSGKIGLAAYSGYDYAIATKAFGLAFETVLILRTYIYVSSSPAAYNCEISFRDDEFAVFDRLSFWNTDGTLRMKRNTGGATYANICTLTENTWYKLELFYNAVNNRYMVFIDGQCVTTTGPYNSAITPTMIYIATPVLCRGILYHDAMYCNCTPVIIIGNSLAGKTISVVYTGRENGIDDVLIVANDDEGVTYLSDVNLGDEVTIALTNDDRTPTVVFEGTVVDLNPQLSMAGAICAIRAHGYGIALRNMRVAQTYGWQSTLHKTGLTQYLPVDGFDETYVSWVEAGSLPYLDDDDDTNKIKAEILGAAEGHFTFANLAGDYLEGATITAASILLKGKNTVETGEGASVTVKLYVSGEDAGTLTWTKDETDYCTKQIDVLSILDTVDDVNGADLTLLITVLNEGENHSHLTITYAELIVTYENKYETLREILCRDTYQALIKGYVNNILGAATTSGYDINGDYVYDDPNLLKYFYFPYEPAINCLRDILNMIAALEYTNAGLHWIVTPYKQLCVAPIGNHDVEGAAGKTVEDVWATWTEWTEENPLVIGGKQILNDFTTSESEANYVLMAGLFEFPTGEYYTEGHPDEWDESHSLMAIVEFGNSDEVPAEVAYRSLVSMKFSIWTTITANALFWFPDSVDLAIETKKIGTDKNIPHINFWAMKDSNINGINICLFIDETNYFKMDLNQFLPEANVWYYVSLPIGEFYRKEDDTLEWEIQGTPEWSDVITRIGFHLDAQVENPPDKRSLFIDDLNVTGSFIRAAYDSSKFTPQGGVKMKLIKDSIAKSDDLSADSTSPFAMVLKCELLKAMATPTTGRIIIPMDERIKAGQLVHVHANEIDATFRITELQHIQIIAGVTTILSLTDDLINTFSSDPNELFTTIIKSVSPDFQDRTMATLKAGEIDLNMTVIAKDYAA